MKRWLSMVLSVLLMLGMVGALPIVNAAEPEVLRVHNWQDYISIPTQEAPELRDVIKEFETKYNAKVEYTTFGTPEIMYNDIKSGKGKYDLVCPSDYMIMKMYKENMLQPFDMENGKLKNIPNYEQYASPLFKNIFKSLLKDETHVDGLYGYAVGYMWGTMGMIYNPEKVSATDMESWSGIWNIVYKNKVTIKDSVRDTYFAALGFVYRDELRKLKDDFDRKEITLVDYQSKLAEVFNRTDDESLKKAEQALISLRDVLYGFEVDGGKNDMISGKIDINFAWSGDAVYVMDEADDKGVTLCYSVPKEGSNVWFDGWCMPKGANTALAQKFIDFMSDPSVAAANMEAIGYTSAIAGDDILKLVNDWYGAPEEATDVTEIDLSYFFEGTLSDSTRSMIVKTEEVGRQLTAQYPDKSTIDRCTVMQEFGDRTDDMLDMWERVKGSSMPVWVIVLIVVVSVVIVGGIGFVVFKQRRGRRRIIKKA